MGVIEKVRAPIDKALDWLVNWIVTMAKKLGKFVVQAGVPQDPKERLDWRRKRRPPQRSGSGQASPSP